MSWFTAHLVLYARFKDRAQQRFPVWENLVLIRADSEEEALAKAEARGREEEGDDDDTFRWDGEPATWIFAGVRNLTACEDTDRRPGDGTEVSYLEMELNSEEAVRQLAGGQAVTVRRKDRFRAANEV